MRGTAVGASCAPDDAVAYERNESRREIVAHAVKDGELRRGGGGGRRGGGSALDFGKDILDIGRL